MTDYTVGVSLGGIGATATAGIFNVLDYGAAADGSTDDTTAIQAAIAACNSSGGGVVHFPTGLYKIVGGVSVTYGSSTQQIIFNGSGKHSSRLLLYASGTENLLEIDCWNTADRSFKIDELGFSLADGTGADCISIKNASRGEINNCYVYGFSSGAGIKFDAEDNKHGNMNRVVSTYVGACEDGIWSDCSGSTSSYNDAKMIIGCTIVNNTQYDIRFTNTGGISGKGNAHFIDSTWIQALSTGTHGIYIDDDVSAVKISNTNIDGQPATTCITIGASSLYTLVSNCAVDGGYIDNSGAAEFTNCHFTASGQTNIRDMVTTYGLIPSAAPAAPTEGMIYYDSSANKLKVYTGSSWETITST